jgi:hypothetical protein
MTAALSEIRGIYVFERSAFLQRVLGKAEEVWKYSWYS